MHDFMQSLQIRCPVPATNRIVDADHRQRTDGPAVARSL